MRRMFIDDAKEQVFQEKGYEVIPFLNDEEVKMMYDFYLKENKIMDSYDPTYAQFSVLNAELENRRKIFDKITGLFLPKLKNVLADYKPIIANFVCKEPGKGWVPVHQNWAVVDEDKYASVSVWCPLQDVNLENGTLAFVDGSHKHFRGPRGSYANRNFKDVDDLIVNNYLTYVPLKAGNAIVLDDSVIHYSAINNSDKIRLAIQLIMIPSEAQGYHYSFREEDGKMMGDLYAVDENYYLGMVNWRGNLDNYQKLKTFEFKNKMWQQAEFEAIMKPKQATANKPLLRRLYEMIAG